MSSSSSEFLAQKIAERDRRKAAGEPEPPRRRKAAAPRKAAPPRKTGPRSPRKTPDYTQGIAGLFQVVAFPLTFVAPADAAAVTHHAPGIAAALNSVAQERPEVAAVLDRVLAGGPYAALLAATLPLVIQLGHNHGLIPEAAAVSMGAAPKTTILSQLREQAESMQAAAHAAA